MIRLPPQNTIWGKTENPFAHKEMGVFICIPEFFHYFLRRYPEKGEDLFDCAGELFSCSCGFPRFPNQGE
jgi:hypothetical protein